MGVSDTTWIAGLLVVALFVSAIGTLSIANRVSIAGLATGTTEANVASSTTITLPTSTVNFGGVAQEDTADTTTDSPAPFVVQNDGSVDIDVTIGSTALWTGTLKVASDVRFECDDGEDSCAGASPVVWTNMPDTGSPVLIFDGMHFDNGEDTLEAEIEITVPADEPAGVHSATVTFTASAA